MKKKDTKALRPDFHIREEATREDETSEAVTPDEQALYAMSQTPGWKVFKNEMNKAILDLNMINKSAIAQGLPLDEIGRNTVVVNLVQDVIEKLQNRITDATEACEKSTR
jgi:hypothetical protein